MLDDWGSLVHRGWDKVNAAIIAPDRATRAELMSLSVSLFKNALEATKEEFPLEPYLGLAHAYCHLSDIDNDAATSYDHAQVAVTYASQLHKKWEEHSPTSTVTEELMRIKDALGCALRQRYIYQGHENDCFCAIELHRPGSHLSFPWLLDG
ncbi:hypothetical protein BDV93DRAFT_559395 [Ceratobasidium sp. AG-I]|nr:hypothetical protein BDV93DRAFT_559395 [Ceratobasidium sp. AG-I]